MGSYSNDSLFSPSTSFNSSSSSTSCTPLANNNNRTTRSQPQIQPKQPVSVLRHPRNRSHVTLSTRYHENQSQFVDKSKREEDGCISDECHRMQKGDEGYKRGVLKQNGTSSKRVVGHSLNGVKDEQSMDDTLLFASTASSDGSNDKGSSSLLECDAWRKDGRERRMQILKEDEISGGSDFQIHHHSRLRTYSDIADRVSDYIQCTIYHDVFFVRARFHTHKHTQQTGPSFIHPCACFRFEISSYVRMLLLIFLWRNYSAFT